MIASDRQAGGDSDWKPATARLVEILRWPVAVVVIAHLFREPLYHLIASLAGHASG